MSITNAYPQRFDLPISSQDSVAVKTPAYAPSGELVSQITINLNQDRPAIIGTQFLAGDYLVRLSMSVNGNPPSDSKLPALTVSYSYNSDTGTADFTVEGLTSQGTDVVDGYNVTQSVRITHNGQGVISAGTFGGRYSGDEWSYTATASVYKL